jgi:hypothetical protein
VGAALRGSPKRPNSILLYILFVLGIYLAIISSSPSLLRSANILNLAIGPIKEEVTSSIPRLSMCLLGAFLPIVSAALLMAHRYHLAKAFRDLANPENCPDLMNIGEHYGVLAVLDEKEKMKGKGFDPEAKYERDTQKKMKSASGFWVAELLAPDGGMPTGYVVGCVGLGEWIKEIRRFFI